MSKFKKTIIRIMSIVGAACMSCGVFINGFDGVVKADKILPLGDITELKNVDINTNYQNFFDPSVVYELPATISKTQDISVIVEMNMNSILDAYAETNQNNSLESFLETTEAEQIRTDVKKESNSLLKRLKSSGVKYELGARYDTLLSGFEIIIKANDYQKVGKALSGKANLILSETYEVAQTIPVTNEVDVYETGIFNSSSSQYQGEGVVVAVLDSGLDYTHSAFDVARFNSDNKRFTKDTVAQDVKKTKAATLSTGLTGADVYMSDKIPFAYDYADKDSDVLPTNSEHGTHVSGIIAGHDDEITGVAPKAQIAFMKVFSDKEQAAKTSWILAGLEDCVRLGVDVINMSLGSGCGFSTERDKQEISETYEKVRQAGISLICAAANSYSSTMGSEKNGNLGLTSNPDTGTVGSPSTYDAALSVASVDGVETPYITYNGEIIYFNESTDSSAKTKDFVEEMLATVGGVDSYEFEYVTIPGLGSLNDYAYDKEYYKGKIALVKRGVSTFEEKIKVALEEKGAAGVIIYNNVSGTIGMSVGEVKGAACSIGQDDGEKLAKAKTGKLLIARSQKAGPFMSDFSSWGPTSDLKIKPEITAHGGEIYSCVPGQAYDRLSGTSMASPNLAGAAAIIRSYVKYSEVFGTAEEMKKNPQEVTSIVNQLMMCTADIVYNKNGLPYAVRKQGAGLINIAKATTSSAYITTYNGTEKMTKAKFELGDDKDETGVYEMTFDINNVSNQAISYDLDTIVQTEGVSETYTSHDERTVTQDGYLLSGASLSIMEVSGGTYSGKTVSIGAKGTAKVTVKVTLSDEDKQYLKDSFENGMYVEGFVTLKAKSGATVDMNVPLLAFFGDWTKAPIFDEEYYDTNADELNKELDSADKLMADAYATRALGVLMDAYIAELGSYYFVQNPLLTPISASKDKIALSNQDNDYATAINGIYAIYAGLLRNVRELNVTIVEDATGKEIFSFTDYNQHKSFNNGGSIIPSVVQLEFKTLEYKLKNNTKYTVKMTTYIDYGENETQKNTRNEFTFPLYIDFEAPIVTDVAYRTEYDKDTQKTKLFADLTIYDNHYAMGVQFGQVKATQGVNDGQTPRFEMTSFGKYVTPVYSSFNSSTLLTIELTDYVAQLKDSDSIAYTEDGKVTVDPDNNTFIAICYDYAMNAATYELKLPDEILSMNLKEEFKDEVRLSPNETKAILDVLEIFPAESWLEVLDYESLNPEIADVVNQRIVAKTSGTATIKVTGYKKSGEKVEQAIQVKVLGPTDEGYVGWYTQQLVNRFEVTGYKTEKAYYDVSSVNREIGEAGGVYDFGNSLSLSMYPSEKVTLQYILDSYYSKDDLKVEFQSTNPTIVEVSENGTVLAKEEGDAVIFVNVLDKNGVSTGKFASVNVTVKEPFKFNSIYLMSYRGNGGTVVVPGDRGATIVYSYAFSNYKYIAKDLAAGDVIDDEDPYSVKTTYIGEDTIEVIDLSQTKITTIESYAFANLTALKKVILPDTLTKIGVGAFTGCTALEEINLGGVKFINERAFSDCALKQVDFSSVVAISNYAFESCPLQSIVLPESSQSIGIGAFYGNDSLTSATFKAKKIKLGDRAFEGCKLLYKVEINAAVIPAKAFYNCQELTEVKLGRDVSVIGEQAFAGTKVSVFELDYRNTSLKVKGSTDTKKGPLLYSYDETEFIVCAPKYEGDNGKTVNLGDSVTKISKGAFTNNTSIYSVVAKNVTEVDAYAFYGCTKLGVITLGTLTSIGNYAFYNTAIAATPSLAKVETIGDYAFAGTDLTSVTVADDTTIGKRAFYNCTALETVTIGNNVTIGDYAFYTILTIREVKDNDTLDNIKYYEEYKYYETGVNGETIEYTYLRYNMQSNTRGNLKTVTIGNGVTIGTHAFEGNVKLNTLTLGNDVHVGDYAFYNNIGLGNVDLSNVASVGEYAFSGKQIMDLYINENNLIANALIYDVIDGELVPVSYQYTSYTAGLTNVNLANVTEISNYAFAWNDHLTAIEFGTSVAKIGDYAFANCRGLEQIELSSSIATLGEYAFMGTNITSINLDGVDTVGSYAFYTTNLTSVTLKGNATVGEYAFAGCANLTQANVKDVYAIGDYAFYATGLTTVDLTNVSKIGDFAFGETKLTEVTLGEKLVSLGENPFYGCAFATYGKEVDGELLASYDVSDKVKVIDGVLYQIAPNGSLELISYPIASKATSYVVADGTARISARAFEGSTLKDVVLAASVRSIGHKAFFDCNELSVVIFQSYQAPILEEEYDLSIFTMEHLPFTGVMYDNSGNVYNGLGISKYFIWNSTVPNNFYFGANFVNYVGMNTEKIVMVRPVNGINYDTFIYGQYFGTVAYGSTALMEYTESVMALIDQLPDRISLQHEAQVVAARLAYEKIAGLDQKSLVSNYAKLTNAESTIAYLKLREEGNNNQGPTPPPVEEENAFVTFLKNNTVGLIIALVIALGAAGYIVVDKVVLPKRKAKKAETSAESTKEPQPTEEPDGGNE